MFCVHFKVILLAPDLQRILHLLRPNPLSETHPNWILLWHWKCNSSGEVFWIQLQIVGRPAFYDALKHPLLCFITEQNQEWLPLLFSFLKSPSFHGKLKFYFISGLAMRWDFRFWFPLFCAFNVRLLLPSDGCSGNNCFKLIQFQLVELFVILTL